MAVIEAISLTRAFAVPAKAQSVWRRIFAPQYETVTAVDGVNLQIDAGEMVGYIGPNGAGKSSTIKLLLGLLHPTGGSVRVLGRDPYQHRLQTNMEIGVVWGNRNLLTWDIAVRDSLEKLRRIYQVSQPDYQQCMRMLGEYIDVEPLLHKHGRHLSLGERMRCNLVCALLHRPRILYLDEPTIGLDILVKQEVRKFLRHINRAWGTTVILTTHDMSDIEELCPRIIVMDKGRLIVDEQLASVRHRLGGGMRISFQFAPDMVPDPRPLALLTDTFPGVSASWEPGPRLALQLARTSTSHVAVIRWVVNRFEPIQLQMEEEPIEEVIKQIYHGGTRHAVV